MTDRTIEQAQQDIIDKFSVFDDWTERYQMLISMGKSTQNYPESKKIDAYKVSGCQSQVWLDSWLENGRLKIQGTSDAAIVSGLIAMLIAVYDNQTPQDILNTPPHFIDDIGFAGHLSPTRSNGLYAMLKRIRQFAENAA